MVWKVLDIQAVEAASKNDLAALEAYLLRFPEYINVPGVFQSNLLHIGELAFSSPQMYCGQD